MSRFVEAGRRRTGGYAVSGRCRASWRGQSLVEFALVLPVLLLLTLLAIDFGRVYLGWINLQNMARIGANFAANNPTAWSGSGDAGIQADYRAQILNDAKAINCTLPTSGGATVVPDPAFPSGTSLGGTAEVGLSCAFQVITPVISSILGNGGSVTVSATAVFPIKSGIAVGGGGGGGASGPTAIFSADPPSGEWPLLVTFTDLSTGSPVVWAWDFGDGATASTRDTTHTYGAAGTYTVTLAVTDAGGASDSTTQQIIAVDPPPATCTVPDFINDSSTTAQTEWAAAGFTTQVNFQQGGLPWTIRKQSLVALSTAPCNTTITLSKNP